MAESSSPAKDRRRRSMEQPGSSFSGDSSSLLSEEQLLCSICLDVFTDPLSTPCGHNFCKSCLTQCWEKSQHCHCPLCKEKFTKKPELKINTTLREVVDLFKKKRGPDKPEVLCDACTGEKLKALKSCLDCCTTFCKTHLEPHNHVSKLKKHKLINPVENLEDYICQKHERPLELFCRDDQTCVCQFCTETDHKNHNTVPIEEESGERKTQLGKTQTDVQQMIEDRLKNIQEIKHSVELSKRSTEKEKASSVEVFTALIRSIERSQAELLEAMEEKQKAAERQAEGLIKALEQEITVLKRRDTELEQLSHTEEHLHLLQIYSSMCSPPHTKNWTEISINADLSGDTARTALSQLQQTLNKKLTKTLDDKLKEAELKRIQQYAASSSNAAAIMPKRKCTFSKDLQRTYPFLQEVQNNAHQAYCTHLDVTLDPDTAQPYLILSADGKQVTHGDKRQNLPDTPQRFDPCVMVLGKQSFSSGRFYYEVQVRGKTNWDFGVVRENINRKGKITLTPQNGFWTVWLRNENQYQACAGPPVPLTLREKLETVGVFVDYEEGLVSFYDVKSRSHIYSFTGQSFTEKLYPYFSPGLNEGGKNSAPLIISPV
ncbi:E3 ubiquitin-protein ligase TRIM39-like isoform X2 [Neoarius graeffei]|uniref:E3 ubiquitin-protein ligase TRIM39-like isoform X2 n=1 Tax=Neoarius graeffei TaxID=443677 RepID=UPI00298C5916|nr:E3 ubiquitin-protein ligase TRIM39-like isoform X2 [Neoarius graeffei]